jgi:toxin ParE1/3/4
MKKWAGGSSASSGLDDSSLVSRSRGRFRGDCRVYPQAKSSAAELVANKIYDGVVSLASFPKQGRPGRTKGTRELVFSPLPYIAVYRVKDEAVEIARVLHGSQRWP